MTLLFRAACAYTRPRSLEPGPRGHVGLLSEPLGGRPRRNCGVVVFCRLSASLDMAPRQDGDWPRETHREHSVYISLVCSPARYEMATAGVMPPPHPHASTEGESVSAQPSQHRFEASARQQDGSFAGASRPSLWYPPFDTRVARPRAFPGRNQREGRDGTMHSRARISAVSAPAVKHAVFRRVVALRDERETRKVGCRDDGDMCG